MTDLTHLPHLDEHEARIDADPRAVWAALLEVLDGAFSHPAAAAYARVVGCADATATGPRPLAVGSTIPGFHVSAADPGRELVLEGSHRFSTYALIFRIAARGPARSALRAESRATFPGVHGTAYRLLVLRSGAHVRGVRRLLAATSRAAERPSRGAR